MPETREDFRRERRRDEQRADPEGQRDAPLVAFDLAQLDRRRGQLERVGEPARDRRQRVVEARSAQEQPRHLGGEVRLLAALLGLARAHAGARGKRARDQRHDEEHDERDPVLAVGDREAPGRRDVEEVEGKRARERGRGAQPEAPEGRDEEHRDEVDDTERDDRRDIREWVDERSAGRNGNRGDKDAYP